MRGVAWLIAVIFGLYLIVRAVVEPFAIDVTDPATYRHDWGGPSLLGVLAVHCGPGLVAAFAMATAAVRRFRSPQTSRATPNVPQPR